jgi:hypothetical protein
VFGDGAVFDIGACSFLREAPGRIVAAFAETFVHSEFL